MLGLSSYNRVLLVVLCLLMPEQIHALLSMLKPGNSFLSNLVKRVHKERPIETLLAIKSPTDENCFLNEFNPIGIPTVRLDASTKLNVMELYNSEALALLCMSEVADSLVLATLAENLDGMRESRIVVILHSLDLKDLKELLRLIGKQAERNVFVNLIVINCISSSTESTVYRMKPFPSPTFVRITNISAEQVFPKVWNNFNGKSAVISPDLFPPRSLLSRDRRTGELKLVGSTDIMLKEFADKYNVQLHLFRPLSELAEIDKLDTYTIPQHEVDMPTRPIVLTMEKLKKFELSLDARYAQFFIVVPCSQEISIGDVYSGLRTNSIILLGSYFMFAIVETFVIFAANWIYQRRPSTQE